MNSRKESQSFSAPGYLLDLLDNHLLEINREKFEHEKLDRSQWICRAIRSQLALELSTSPAFWRRLSQVSDE